MDAVKNPSHYQLVLADGTVIQCWDLLDALFPDDPLLWNAGKYLFRAGRKDALAQDLGKLVRYVERRLAREGTREAARVRAYDALRADREDA